MMMLAPQIRREAMEDKKIHDPSNLGSNVPPERSVHLAKRLILIQISRSITKEIKSSI
jgi:hypothetical protein